MQAWPQPQAELQRPLLTPPGELPSPSLVRRKLLPLLAELRLALPTPPDERLPLPASPTPMVVPVWEQPTRRAHPCTRM